MVPVELKVTPTACDVLGYWFVRLHETPLSKLKNAPLLELDTINTPPSAETAIHLLKFKPECGKLFVILIQVVPVLRLI